MAIERQTAFSYAALAPDVRDRVETATSRLHDLERRTSEAVVQIGHELNSVSRDLPHGQFGSWIESEFGWSRMTAHRFMTVADRFGDLSQIVTNASPSALYVLASESTPDEVRVEFTELASLGEKVTHKDVKQRVDEHKRAQEIPVAEWRGVDEDTGEILDEEEIEAEYVDPSDPSTFAWSPPPAPKPTPQTQTQRDFDPEPIAAEIVRKHGRGRALEIADSIYEIAE